MGDSLGWKIRLTVFYSFFLGPAYLHNKAKCWIIMKWLDDGDDVDDEGEHLDAPQRHGQANPLQTLVHFFGLRSYLHEKL